MLFKHMDFNNFFTALKR